MTTMTQGHHTVKTQTNPLSLLHPNHPSSSEPVLCTRIEIAGKPLVFEGASYCFPL